MFNLTLEEALGVQAYWAWKDGDEAAHECPFEWPEQRTPWFRGWRKALYASHVGAKINKN